MKEPPADIHLPTALPRDFQEINQRFPIYLYMIITYKKFLWKKNRTHVSVKFSSVIHLTVDNYYLRGFGFVSTSV